MSKLPKDGFGLRVRFIHPADDEEIWVTFVSFLVMDFTVDSREKRRDVLDEVIHNTFELRGKTAKGNGRKQDDEVALHDLFCNDAVIVVGVAHAWAAHPAKKITRAYADLFSRSVTD